MKTVFCKQPHRKESLKDPQEEEEIWKEDLTFHPTPYLLKSLIFPFIDYFPRLIITLRVIFF
jgi:hypothetical protein